MAVPNTSTNGIFQSDIAIRAAIIAGIADLRAKTWLLDYVFAGIPHDTLTAKEYGVLEVEKAKKWFLSTDIPVVMDTRVDDAALPCISIALMESSEDASTLSDTHYDVVEDYTAEWPIVAGPMTPLSYDSTEGILVYPEAAVSGKLFPGMIIIDRVGGRHEVLETPTSNTAIIDPSEADFSGSLLKPAVPSHVVELESIVFKETYSIGCHTLGEPSYLSYLHSIITFILLRYKESLLEARGFERSEIGSSNFTLDGQFENELVFSRYIQITGYVRQYWPKEIKRKIDGVVTAVGYTAVNDTTTTLDTIPELEVIQDLDAIDIFGKRS